MEYTVKKNRANRIAMRFTAAVFILVAVLRFAYLLISSERKSVIITLLCLCCFAYGITLLRQTLKPQAYDITYVFGDKTITIKMRKQEKKISYGDISDLGYVVPNENLDYCLIQVYVGKEQYVISFTENSNVGKALYEMIKMKKEEAQQINQQ